MTTLREAIEFLQNRLRTECKHCDLAYLCANTDKKCTFLESLEIALESMLIRTFDDVFAKGKQKEDEIRMSDNIDKDEIRKAIDRLQLEHPVHFAFDATRIVEPSLAKAVQDDIDRVAKSLAKDASIHIICEMAKLYLDGVKPTVEPKKSRGEWIPCSERLPEEDGKYMVCWCGDWGVDICFADYSKCGKYWYSRYGSEYRGITAWMPLPEPYKEGEEK